MQPRNLVFSQPVFAVQQLVADLLACNPERITNDPDVRCCQQPTIVGSNLTPAKSQDPPTPRQRMLTQSTPETPPIPECAAIVELYPPICHAKPQSSVTYRPAQSLHQPTSYATL